MCQEDEGHLGQLVSSTATKLCLLAPPVIQLLALSPPPHPSVLPSESAMVVVCGRQASLPCSESIMVMEVVCVVARL